MYISSLIQFVKTSYIDLTENFLINLSEEIYIYFLYNFYSNVILVEPLKTRQAGEITKPWTSLYNNLTHSGHDTKHYIVDNECNADFKRYCRIMT